MTRRELVEEALKLPPEERAELVEALQVSLLGTPLADWQRELLDERLAEHERAPEDATPWEEVRGRLRRDSAE